MFLIEDAKNIYENWNKKLNSSINNYLNIEKNFIIIKENINLYKSNIESKELFFLPSENEFNRFYENLRNFGRIKRASFIFKKYPLNQIPEYETNYNIITKTGTGIIYKGELNQLCEEYIWQINILKTQSYNIMIGVPTIVILIFL